MSTILPDMPGLALRPQTSDREKLAATAKQFEAIFVRQMLAAARKTEFGGGDIMGSGALDTFRQLQDEHFADVAASTGALGLASIIEAQMARFLPDGGGDAASQGSDAAAQAGDPASSETASSKD